MSDTQTPAISYDQAYDTVVRGIHNRVFFDKLASHGIQPANEQEATHLLEMGEKLAQVEQSTKEASAPVGTYAELNAALDNALVGAGLGAPVKQAQEQSQMQAHQHLAEQFLQDPAIYNSVLVLKQADADSIQQAHNIQSN